MLLIVQFALAGLLVLGASAIVALWLMLLTLAYGGQGGLMPWVVAGVILYGLAFIAAAATLGVPGIVWANKLASHVPFRWRRAARVPGRIGTAALILGFGVALVVLLGEQLRAKNPDDGRVIYRDAAASSAMAASAAKSPATGASER